MSLVEKKKKGVYTTRLDEFLHLRLECVDGIVKGANEFCAGLKGVDEPARLANVFYGCPPRLILTIVDTTTATRECH